MSLRQLFALCLLLVASSWALAQQALAVAPAHAAALRTRAERTGIARLLGDLAARGITVRDVSTRQSSLEDVFLSLVSEDAA